VARGLPDVGERFDRFRITRLLGQGGMGAVYVAVQEGLAREVALKVLLPSYADDPGYRARFTREAAILARLDSPHIVHVYDHGETDGRLWIATQLVTGGDLERVLRERGPLAPRAALAVARQVAEALAAAHDGGVVHRDVKPSNVLLRQGTGHPHAYLCDFGIATTGGAGLTTPGSVVGTWSYLAPERCRGEAATPRGDVYSVGCLLWALLTGTPPFTGTEIEVGMGHLNGPVRQFAEGAPYAPAVNGVLARALAKDPADRHPDAHALATELAAVERQVDDTAALEPAPPAPRDAAAGAAYWRTLPQPALAAPPEPAAAAAPAVPVAAPASGRVRRRWPTAVLLVLLLVAGAGGGWWWASREDEPTNRTRGDLTPAQPVTPCRVDPERTEPTCPLLLGEGTRSVSGDVDGDGDREPLVLGEAEGGVGVVVVQDREHAERWATLPTTLNRVLVGDVDGDERDDLVLLSPGRGFLEVAAALSTGAGFAEPVDWGSLPSRFGQQGRFAMADYTGDGRADVAAVGAPGAGVDVQVLVSDGERFGAAEEWAASTTWEWAEIKLGRGDFDGDDRADLVVLGQPDSGGIDLRVLTSTGAGFAANRRWASVPGFDWDTMKLVVGDFDGDGRDDLGELGTPATGGVDVRVFRSEGDTFAEHEGWALMPDLPFEPGSLEVVDLDTDGTGDVVLLTADGDQAVLETFVSTGEELERGERIAPPGWTWDEDALS